MVPVKPAKRVDYLQLASLLLTRAPSESTARSVEFLVRLCDGSAQPMRVPGLPWFESDEDLQNINASAPSSLRRLAPVMRFTVKLRG